MQKENYNLVFSAVPAFSAFFAKFMYLCIREKIGLLISRFTGGRKVRTP